MMREDDRIASIYNISSQQVHENIMDILSIFTSMCVKHLNSLELFTNYTSV